MCILQDYAHCQWEVVSLAKKHLRFFELTCTLPILTYPSCEDLNNTRTSTHPFQHLSRSAPPPSSTLPFQHPPLFSTLPFSVISPFSAFPFLAPSPFSALFLSPSHLFSASFHWRLFSFKKLSYFRICLFVLNKESSKNHLPIWLLWH